MRRPTAEDLAKFEAGYRELAVLEWGGYFLAHMLAWWEGSGGPSNPDEQPEIPGEIGEIARELARMRGE